MKMNQVYKAIAISLSFLFLLTANAATYANKITRITNDTAITTQLKSRIAQDPTISNFDVNVSTNHGVVIYDGEVNANNEASTLVEMAQSIKGVRDVDASRLHVKESDQPITDTIITAKVKGLFIQRKLHGNRDIAPMAISVETNNGIVYLSGKANSLQKRNAIALAKQVKGVKQVVSRIQVARD